MMYLLVVDKLILSQNVIKVNTKIASYYMYGGISFTQDS